MYNPNRQPIPRGMRQHVDPYGNLPEPNPPHSPYYYDHPYRRPPPPPPPQTYAPPPEPFVPTLYCLSNDKQSILVRRDFVNRDATHVVVYYTIPVELFTEATGTRDLVHVARIDAHVSVIETFLIERHRQRQLAMNPNLWSNVQFTHLPNRRCYIAHAFLGETTPLDLDMCQNLANSAFVQSVDQATATSVQQQPSNAFVQGWNKGLQQSGAGHRYRRMLATCHPRPFLVLLFISLFITFTIWTLKTLFG